MRRDPSRYSINAVPGGICRRREISSRALEICVFLAKQGAEVTGIDVGRHLIQAAYLLAKINGVDCKFQVADASHLPYGAERFDVVIGRGVLHHLTPNMLFRAVQETHAVLKGGGVSDLTLTRNAIRWCGSSRTSVHCPSLDGHIRC
jgi:ubiquinone/menaquinone biosynthesis C-methylase UbiE